MPKTAEQERLEGYPGHRKPNANAPEADRDIPGPPKWLGNISTRAYHDLVRLVGNDGMRVMAKSDQLALSMVCEAFQDYRRYNDIIEIEGPHYRNGIYKEDEEGNVIVNTIQVKKHPLIAAKENAWQRLMTGLGQFGLTPYQRQKVSAIKVDNVEETPAEKRAKQKQAAIEAAKKLKSTPLKKV